MTFPRKDRSCHCGWSRQPQSFRPHAATPSQQMSLARGDARTSSCCLRAAVPLGRRRTKPMLSRTLLSGPPERANKRVSGSSSLLPLSRCCCWAGYDRVALNFQARPLWLGVPLLRDNSDICSSRLGDCSRQPFFFRRHPPSHNNTAARPGLGPASISIPHLVEHSALPSSSHHFKARDSLLDLLTSNPLHVPTHACTTGHHPALTSLCCFLFPHSDGVAIISLVDDHWEANTGVPAAKSSSGWLVSGGV